LKIKNVKVNTPLYAGHQYLISLKCQVLDGETSSLIGAIDPCHTSCNQPNTTKTKCIYLQHKKN